MRRLFAVLLVSGITVACGAGNLAVLEVKTGPGTSYPCGVNGVSCLDMNGQPNHMCCSENETCGGGKYSVGCPADSCCFIGSSEDMFGVHRNQPSAPVTDPTKGFVACGSDMYCPRYDECGSDSNPNCPAGMCCYTGIAKQSPEHE